MQRRIGLTGGIASGKSSVGRLLEQHGWPVLDADQFARDALAANTTASQAVAERYGTKVGSASDLDRKALGRIVFSTAEERQWLEDLIHPVVRQRFDEALEALQTEPVVVLMIPLLFEAGLDKICSEVWLVDCEPEQQLQRMLHRDGLNISEAQARLDAQWPLHRKRQLADVVIDNSGTSDELIVKVTHYVQAAPGTTW